jgi:hypothetical protein
MGYNFGLALNPTDPGGVFGNLFGGLFGGGGGNKPPNMQKGSIPFNSNPFTSFDRNQNQYITNPGTPQFNPQTGQFTGVQDPSGQLVRPDARVSKAENQGAALTRALIQNLPSLLGLFNANIAPNEMAQLQSSMQTSPLYAQLAQQIARANAQSEAGTTNELLRGTGGDTVREADKLAREVDPEYYGVRSAASSGLQGLLKPGLSGGETEAIQRSLNQQNQKNGSLITPTSSSTVANAMTFGNAARDRMSQAVNQATQFLPTARSGVDTFQQATGKPGNTTGFQQGAGQQTFGTGNSAASLFGNLSANNANNSTQMSIAKMQQPDTFDRITQALGSVNYIFIIGLFLNLC